jgi:hypothetical protein
VTVASGVERAADRRVQVADVMVSRERLWEGALPDICVKTGRPTTTRVRTELRNTLPAWAFLLLILGIVPFLVAWLHLREPVTARLPVHDDVLDRHDAVGRSIIVTLVLALIAVGLAIGAREPVLLLVGLGLGMLALVQSTWLDDRWVRLRLVPGTPFVELRRVHPSFAAAVARQRVDEVDEHP